MKTRKDYFGRTVYIPEISDMIGEVFTSVTRNQNNQDEIYFSNDTGKFTMTHHQDCCEDVYIESIVGDLEDLVDTPILKAEEVVSYDEDTDENCTYTFYKFSTIKGYVDIRWVGSSNGYYSESVDLEYQLNKNIIN